MSESDAILIAGAGPTGLGAAYRLQELGYEDFRVLEASDRPGGLATSYTDPQGFTWDVGGHVQFSHYAYYDRMIDAGTMPSTARQQMTRAARTGGSSRGRAAIVGNSSRSQRCAA